MDDPLTIVSGAVDNHVKMINEYKGVPGVQPARLQEGFQVIPNWPYPPLRHHWFTLIYHCLTGSSACFTTSLSLVQPDSPLIHH